MSEAFETFRIAEGPNTNIHGSSTLSQKGNCNHTPAQKDNSKIQQTHKRHMQRLLTKLSPYQCRDHLWGEPRESFGAQSSCTLSCQYEAWLSPPLPCLSPFLPRSFAPMNLVFLVLVVEVRGTALWVSRDSLRERHRMVTINSAVSRPVKTGRFPIGSLVDLSCLFIPWKDQEIKSSSELEFVRVFTSYTLTSGKRSLSLYLYRLNLVQHFNSLLKYYVCDGFILCNLYL